MNNDRPLLTEDLDRCAWHPDRASVGWQDVRGEDGALASTVGACMECVVSMAVPLSPGKPCLCGPGFCASAAGVGYYGFCGGSRAVGAPDCSRCGAPHQSDAGCWACTRRGGADAESVAMAQTAVRALRLGLSWDVLFEEQDRRRKAGGWPTLDGLMDEVEAGTLVLADALP